jgi:flagellar assembly protein FliH
MKSLSRIYPQAARAQLEEWTPAELDVEVAVPTMHVPMEQILAIFSDGEEHGAGNKAKSSQPILRRLTADLAVTPWQPDEIDLHSPLAASQSWDSFEPSNELSEDAGPEIWPEGPDPEKEAATILMQARTQAEDILLEAQATADKVIRQAQEEIDSEKKAGYRQGWNEGRNELREALQAVHAMTEETRLWRDSLMTQGEQILIEMLKEIAQTMFGEGVRLDANALQINLNRMMENAQKLGDLNIFLNTRDVELLDPSWSEYQLLITGNRVKIIPSEKITLGGCVIKGSMGMVDGRVETQLSAIINTIEETRGASE